MVGKYREVLCDLFMRAQLYGGFIASVTCQKVCDMQDPGKVTTVPPFTPQCRNDIESGVKKKKETIEHRLVHSAVTKKGRGGWTMKLHLETEYVREKLLIVTCRT